MTRFLSPQQVLFIHSRLISTTGGGTGIRDLGLLESAVARPQATFDGNALYVTLFDKAAALLASLAHNHPFVDGNKRVAITAAAMMLRQNGFMLSAENQEVERFVLHVVQSHPPIEEIAHWLQHQSQPIV